MMLFLGASCTLYTVQTIEVVSNFIKWKQVIEVPPIGTTSLLHTVEMDSVEMYGIIDRFICNFYVKNQGPNSWTFV